MNSHDPAIDSAGRLGEFLDNSITELKGGQTADKLPPVALPSLPTTAPIKPKGPNKFSELADRIARTRKALDARADKLITRVETLGEKGNAAFDQHEATIDEHERGITSMEEALSGLIGHNGAPVLDE